MNGFAQFVQDNIIPTLTTFATVAVPVISVKIFQLLTVQAQAGQNNYVQGVMQRLIALAGQKVLMLEQTEVAYLKQQLASGNITQAQLPGLLMGIKDHAVAAVLADAKAHGLWAQADKVFNGDGASLDKWLADVIESQVAQLPKAGLNAAIIPSASTAKAVSVAQAPAVEATPVVVPLVAVPTVVVPAADPVVPPPAV